MLWQAFGRWGGIVSEIASVGPIPTQEGIGTFTDNATGSGDVNVPYPAIAILADDIALFQIILHDSTDANEINAPAGWTLISDADINGLAVASHAVYYKRMSGGESGTVNITTTDGHEATDCFGGIISIWRGCKTTGAPHEGLGTNTASSANMQGAAVTTTGANRKILHFGANLQQSTATPASGYSEAYDVQTASGAGEGSVHLYAKDRASAGSEAAATHTLSASRQWQTIALALVPVGG
jgi:hypothetical protein